MRRLSLFWLATFALGACSGDRQQAYARRVTSPEQLIGGPAALGAVGDWEIGNDKIRIIIQDQGWSRGFGIFGGGIIDADIVRPGARGTGSGGGGNDRFGEYFPTLFLQAFDVQDRRGVAGIEIIDDGSDGSAAILRTRASGGDFLTTVKTLVGAVIPSGLRFETDYVIKPGARHVEIIGRVINTTTGTLDLSGRGIASALPGGEVDSIPVPLGDVLLFGGANQVFAPGAVGSDTDASVARPVGFDVRFSLEAAYANQRLLPAFPGLVVDHLASSGEGVSYGMAVADSDSNYVWQNRGEYEKDPQVKVTRHSMIVPFMVSAFAGVFFEMPPVSFPAGETFEFRKYFVVGYGDVASVAEEIHSIRGTALGEFEGEVVSALSGLGEADAQVHILDAEQRPFTQTKTDAAGRFRAKLPEGRYHYRVTAPGRAPFPSAGEIAERAFDVKAGEGIHRLIHLPPPAYVDVVVLDETGRPLPAKVTVTSTYAEEFAGRDPLTHLFVRSLGESRRATDLTWRDVGADERQFVEAIEVTSDGRAQLLVRPNVDEPYSVFVTRGPEYERYVRHDVRLAPGERVQLQARLRRVVDTRDYISADFHVHSGNSIDSGMALDHRVTSGAAEGLEMIVATDHNWVTDYQPIITALNLQDWMGSIVGVELSTLEMGHFNGFPVRYDLGATSHFPYVGTCDSDAKVNRTAFDWVQCSPQQLFDNLRALGPYGPENTVVQVNHPRDSVLGYFNQYYVNPITGEPQEPDDRNFAAVGIVRAQSDNDQFALSSFSHDFDAIEVYNGKRIDSLHAFRLSQEASDADVAALRDHRCASGHPDNDRGKVVLRAGGYIAYPGAVDDWLNLLNLGYQFTATGNSDSHDLHDEIGSPRTYVYLPPGAGGKRRDLAPGAVTPLEIVEALRSHRAIATNGPFVRLSVRNSAGAVGEMGDLVAAPGGRVDVDVNIAAADWIPVDRVVLYANGEPVLDRTARLTRSGGVQRQLLTHELAVSGADVVVVAEVYGDGSLFPVVVPTEDPPNTLAAALGSLTSSLGLSGVFAASDGVTSPAYVQKVRPYALTNPVWIDVNGNGVFDAPGPTRREQPAPDEDCPVVMLKAAPRLSPMNEIFVDDHRGGRRFAPGDIRKIFFGHHAH